MYTFGKILLPTSQVFCRTQFSYASVNIKPVVPGHMLVMPLRKVARFNSLEPEELGDLFATVQLISRAFEAKHHPDAFSVVVQDGEAAGQTIPHVHVHILPRVKGDFGNNDDIYQAIEANDGKPLRTETEMAKEAVLLRALLPSHLTENI